MLEGFEGEEGGEGLKTLIRRYCDQHLDETCVRFHAARIQPVLLPPSRRGLQDRSNSTYKHAGS